MIGREPGDTSGDDDSSDIEPDRPRCRWNEDATQPSDLHVAGRRGADCLAARGRIPSPPQAAAFRCAGATKHPASIADVEVPVFTGPRHGSENAPAGNAPCRPNLVGRRQRRFRSHLCARSERTEPQQPQSTTRPHPTVSASKEGRASGGRQHCPKQPSRQGLPPASPSVSQQNVPAPMASTALVLVDSIAGSDAAWRAYTRADTERDSCFRDTCFRTVAQDPVASCRARHGHRNAALRRRAALD